MNLKEAFRYQNKLQNLLNEAQYIFGREKNVTRVENTCLLHKVFPDAKDETTVEAADSEYAEHITEIAALTMFLMEQKELLSHAIRMAKQSMDFDFDGQVGLNAQRQQLARGFKHMAEIRCSEVLLPGAGTGYKFNAEGNQVPYRCDLKRVTSINFDRNKIRSYANALNKKADLVSAELDRSLVNTTVDYEPPFDVNDTFDEVLTAFLS